MPNLKGVGERYGAGGTKSEFVLRKGFPQMSFGAIWNLFVTARFVSHCGLSHHASSAYGCLSNRLGKKNTKHVEKQRVHGTIADIESGPDGERLCRWLGPSTPTAPFQQFTRDLRPKLNFTRQAAPHCSANTRPPPASVVLDMCGFSRLWVFGAGGGHFCQRTSLSRNPSRRA